MKPPVKTPALLTIFLLSAVLAGGQIRQVIPSAIAADVRKVIDDYPNRFEHITGELIVQNPQSTDYHCNFKVTGAEEATITRYSGKKQIISSWQAVMLTSESFDEAKKKFRSLFNQLNNLEVGSQRLSGIYETPVDSRKFTSVILSFPPSATGIEKLRVEISLEATGMEWKVKLLVYDIEREDAEQGPATEGQ